MNEINKYITLALIIITQFGISLLPVKADSVISCNKQQEKMIDNKGNTVCITPNYSSYKDRNNSISEKVVAIYDKHAPDGTYGARYVLYTPIGHYVGYHRITQQSPNGYGFAPVWDGGVGSDTPCFRTINEALHYYYPQWY